MARVVLWLGLVGGCCLAGCQAVGPSEPPDPLVEEILSQPTPKKAPPPGATDPRAAVVLLEVPLQTPLAQARATLEQHGFSCWSGVPDAKGMCLHCTAWKRRGRYYGDRVVVKLFYENQRVIKVEVSVDREAWRGL
jgi:hypothetical protein